MKSYLKAQRHARKRQGPLLAFGMTGAMALALAACNNSGGSGPTMIAPPGNFDPSQAKYLSGTNQAPTAPYMYDGGGGHGGFLTGSGYYPMYGYPNYYYRPAPGATVELVTGGSSGYVASSPGEGQESVERGGFGEHGAGGGEGGGEGE